MKSKLLNAFCIYSTISFIFYVHIISILRIVIYVIYKLSYIHIYIVLDHFYKLGIIQAYFIWYIFHICRFPAHCNKFNIINGAELLLQPCFKILLSNSFGCILLNTKLFRDKFLEKIKSIEFLNFFSWSFLK